MFLKIIHRIWHKLAFKLTIWYAAIFTISLIGALCVLYVMVTNSIQRSIDEGLLEDLDEVSATLALAGVEHTLTVMNIEAQSEGIDKMYLRLMDQTGHVIATSDMKYWNTAEINKNAVLQVSKEKSPIFEMQKVPGRPHKIRVVYGMVDTDKILQIGVSLKEKEHFFNTIYATIVPIMICFVLFSAVIGWFMVNRALSGGEKVTSTASDISK